MRPCEDVVASLRRLADEIELDQSKGRQIAVVAVVATDDASELATYGFGRLGTDSDDDAECSFARNVLSRAKSFFG